MTIDEIREAVGLAPIGNRQELTGVSTDSRTIQVGMLFVALQGGTFDGNNYINAAFQRGAASALVDRRVTNAGPNTFEVADTLVAYGKIASAWRRRFAIPIVAVTGSVGKTTMKEMIALALSPLGPVLKTEKNENNEVGLPLTLLRLDSSHRSAVVEMGMRDFGQINYLAEIAEPKIGVITMIGESHIELLGSREGIADAKGELIEALKPGSTAVINADDQFFFRLASKTRERVISFGCSHGANVKVVDEDVQGEVRTAHLLVDGYRHQLRIHSPARHDLINAAGAVAVAYAAEVPVPLALAALENYRPSHMRMEVLTSRSGATVLSDCYNAAPSSVKSALRTLAERGDGEQKIAFLGDMRELGDYTKDMHTEVADEAARLGIDQVYPVGAAMTAAFSGAEHSFVDSTEAADFVTNQFELTPRTIVLVKGSRALELEKVVGALVNI